MDKRWRYLAAAGVALFAAFRLPELTRYALWYDEVFSVTLAQMDWGEMLRAAVADRTNPPLFYVALKLWMVFGDSVAWLRLLPCLIAIVTAIPLVALARRFVSDDTTGLAAAATTMAAAAASPLHVFLSNELRGYSLLTFCSVVSLLAFYRLTEMIGAEERILAQGDSPNGVGDMPGERKRRWILLGFANALLVYTHYFGWLLVGAEVVVAWLWYRAAVKQLLGATGLAAAIFAPWAVVVLVKSGGVARPLANVDWITTPTARDMPLFFDALVARVLTPSVAGLGTVIMLLLVGVMFIAITTPTRAAGSRARELAVFALLPVLVAFVASLTFARSAFVPRYLMVAAPAWWLLVGATVAALGGLTARGAHELEREFRVVATAVTFGAFTLTAGALREIRGGEKIAWDQIVAAIAKDAGQSGGTIYTLEGFTALPAAFYAGNSAPQLTVKPAGDLSAIQPPGWLITRSRAAGDSPLGGGLAPNGITLTRIAESAVPSHAVAVFRISR